MDNVDGLMDDLVGQTTEYKKAHINAMEGVLAKTPQAILESQDQTMSSWVTWGMAGTVILLLVCVVLRFRKVKREHGF